jgi:hypothetical protein
MPFAQAVAWLGAQRPGGLHPGGLHPGGLHPGGLQRDGSMSQWGTGGTGGTTISGYSYAGRLTRHGSRLTWRSRWPRRVTGRA